MQPSLLRNGVKTAWSPAVYRKLAESGAGRSKRSPPGSDLQIVLDGQGKSMQLHLTPRSRHPVTADTVFEWVAEDGQRTMWRGVNTDHCWYSGHVDDRMVRLFFLSYFVAYFQHVEVFFPIRLPLSYSSR